MAGDPGCHRRGGEEIWISRRFMGEVSRVDDPVLIVALNRELELKGGVIVSFRRRIIEMPVAVNASVPTRGAGTRNQLAPVVGIRLEPNHRRIFKLIPIAAGTLVSLCLVAAGLMRVGELRQKHAAFVGSDRSFLELDGHDDFLSVTKKLGAPAPDHTKEDGAILYWALGYPDRRYTVILMAADVGGLKYIGTVDRNWLPIHAASTHMDAILRGLRRF